MANNKSSKKRILINKRNRLQNRFYKSSVQTLIKRFFKDLEVYKNSKNSENEERLKRSLSLAYSMIDKSAKKKLFHKNTAARKKSRLRSSLKAVL